MGERTSRTGFEIQRPNIRIQCDKCKGFNVEDKVLSFDPQPQITMTMQEFAKLEYRVEPYLVQYYKHQLVCLDCGNKIEFLAPYKD